MRTLAWPLALLLALSVAAPATATDSTYHGRISNARFWCGDVETHPHPSVQGTWNLNLGGNTAVVSINVAYEKHDVSFGINGGVGEQNLPLSLTFPYGVATFDGKTFSWEADVSACTDGHPYDHVLYTGNVGRP